MFGEMPCGRAALHPAWPEASWNLSALFTHDLITLHALGMLKERFDCRPAIDAIHGSLPLPWNGGRISHVPTTNPAAVKTPLKNFNGEGIGVYYTFSNHLLGQEDLADKACNRLLDAIDNGTGLNGVIVASDLLFDYIRRGHPDLKLTASIVKVTVEGGKGKVDYYRKQADRFDRVMLHTDDNWDLDLLDQLDRKKMEILVNENCIRNCAVRAQHYDLMIEQQRSGGPYTPHEGCRYAIVLGEKNLSCNMTEAELKSVYDMGFRQFKLQGRADKASTYLCDFSRYLLEPTLTAPLVFKYLVEAKDVLDRKLKAKQRSASSRSSEASRPI